MSDDVEATVVFYFFRTMFVTAVVILLVTLGWIATHGLS